MQINAPKSTPSAVYRKASEAAVFVRDKVNEARLRKPLVAIICGSGLGGLADTVEETTRIDVPFSDIPHFPPTTVQGHAGRLVFGYISSTNVPVVLLVGRAHFYEGHDIDHVAFATRVMHLLGVNYMIVTNAAGGLNGDYAVGDIVVINDHLNLPGLGGFHPLRGPNADEFGDRFPPLSDAYSLELRRLAHAVWRKLDRSNQSRKLHEGVYAFVSGPTYETRAECRMLRALGADVVGMSTVPEIIAARQSGIKILALSLVTNRAVMNAVTRGDDAAVQDMDTAALEAHLTLGCAKHQEVLEAGQNAAKDMQVMVKEITGQIGAMALKASS